MDTAQADYLPSAAKMIANKSTKLLNDWPISHYPAWIVATPHLTAGQDQPTDQTWTSSDLRSKMKSRPKWCVVP